MLHVAGRLSAKDLNKGIQPGGSAVVVLDKDGRIRFAKDGALTPDEVRQVMTLLRSLLA
ncbi:Protein ytfJ precursor [Cronobacter sakazakii 701]|nr:Protein ytfJ precursor [Cronobacter sakazakii 701]